MKDKKRIKALGKIALATTMAFSTTSTLMPVLPVIAQENVGQETKITRSEIISAVAKSQMSGQNIEMSLDGNPSTYTDSNYNDAQGTGALPQIYTFTLNEVKELCRVRILPRSDSSNGRITQYSIAVGMDASSLQIVASSTTDPASSAWIEIPFTPTQGQVVQMTLYSDFSANVVTTAEVEMYAVNQSSEDTNHKETLKQIMDQALSLQAGSYSSSSWQNLSAALSEAQSIYENEEAQETTISEIEEILTLALNGLYAKDSTSSVNKDVLSARIDEANAIIISSYRIPDLFPADQVTALKEIVANAEIVLQDAGATQEIVNQAADQVNQGMTFEEEQEGTVTVRIAGTKDGTGSEKVYSVDSFEEAIQQAIDEGKITNENFVTSIIFEKGVVTDDDLRYISKEIAPKKLQTFSLNLSNTLVYQDDGAATTVFPASTFKNFSGLENVSLIGWTELDEQAFYGCDSLTTISIPDVTVLHYNALAHSGLQSIELPSVTRIEEGAFSSCDELTSISMPKVQNIIDAPFYGCRKLTEIRIPSTIQTLDSTRFGYYADEKVHVIFEGNTAPNMTGTIVDPSYKYGDGVSVTVPYEGLSSYFDDVDTSGLLTKEDLSSWLNGSELSVDGAYTITYKVEGQEDQFAYIPTNQTIGEKRMLTVEAPEGKEFKGWNTAADGTGTTITTKSKLTEDTVVYPIFTSTVDKSELQKLYDEAKDTQSDVNSFKYFTTSLNKAKTVLEDANATQDEVDKAKVDLEARYYAVKVQELNEIYNPKNEFNFMDYTTESLVPVINMWGITHNRSNGNYQENEAKGNIGQMKGWYEDYLEAIEGLQKAGEDAVYIGITNESSKTNKEQGSFEVVSAERVYVDGEEKIKLVVNFNNTGIHPIYGKELPNANRATEFKKLGSINDKTSFRYQGYGADGKHMISAGMDEKTKLPEASNWYSGVQGVCYIDPDINYVTFSVDNEIYSSWIYRIPELPEPADTIAPEVTVTTSNNGQPTNQSVKVTITANEAIQDIEGWTRVNETTLEKVYDANTSENVIVTDIAGNTTKTNVVVQGIDKTAPKTDVTYETTENGVLVTIKADEAIQDVEGWTRVDDQTLQKLFTENGTEEVIVQDTVGNQTKVTVTVDSIDKESPIVKVEYEMTPEGVQVTITANEPIRTPDGWTKVSDTVFTKLYTENTEEKITIYDLSGNSTDITIFVTGIGSETGEETKPGEDGKPGDSEKPEIEDTEKTDGEDTATNMYAGIFGGLMAAAVAGLGVLGLLKRKKK